MVKIEEQDISHIQSRISQKVGKKLLLKLIPVSVVSNYIYLKIVLLKTKSVKIVGTKNINFLHCSIEQKAVETIFRCLT